jgi:hypothetical protein
MSVDRLFKTMQLCEKASLTELTIEAVPPSVDMFSSEILSPSSPTKYAAISISPI